MLRKHFFLTFMNRFLGIFYLMICFSLYAQNIGPVIQGEKRPTTKDPSYKPSVLPFYLQKKSSLSPVESYLLNPAQSPEDFAKNQFKDKQQLPINISSQEEELLNKIQQDDQAREYYIQKYFLPQLGRENLNEFHLSYLPEPIYQETKWQRRWVIFMLSFPITTGISYGVYKTYKSISGLNHQETVGIFSIGILFSLYIVYYDENFHQSLQEYSKYLKKNSK